MSQQTVNEPRKNTEALLLLQECHREWLAAKAILETIEGGEALANAHLRVGREKLTGFFPEFSNATEAIQFTDDVRKNSGELRRAIDKKKRLFKKSLDLRLFSQSLKPIGFTLGGLAIFVTAIWAYHCWAHPLVWETRYYSGVSFSGEPEEINERSIRHFWGALSKPAKGIPGSYFSSRWRSCLVLEEDTFADFVLASDDGSRLKIDGVVVAEIWEIHGLTETRKRVKLARGTHELVVEYFQAYGDAAVVLRAGFNGEEPHWFSNRLFLPKGDCH